MKKLCLILMLLSTLSVLAADNDYLGFALKQTGNVDISYDSSQPSVTNSYEARVEALWYRSQFPREEVTYTITMKHGGWVQVMSHEDRTIKFDMKKGDQLTFSMKDMFTIEIIAYQQYGLEVQINEEGSRPILIQMPGASKYPSTSFNAFFVK